jgi:Ran GTPase-activating protein (RanGAP) involved in mRNA processing and transport
MKNFNLLITTCVVVLLTSHALIAMDNNLKSVDYSLFVQGRTFKLAAQKDKIAITNNELESIGSVINNINLIEIDLSYNNIGDEGMLYLTSLIKKKNSIKRLNFHDCHLEKSFDSIAELIKENTITHLDISGNAPNDDAIKRLSQALKDNTSLISLNMGGNELTDAHIEDITKSLVHHKTLTRFSIFGSKIDKVGGEAIAHLIKINRSITALNLQNSNIEAKTFVIIAEALMENKFINEIDLSWNKIFENNSLEVLAKLIEKNNTLVTLNLNNNRVNTNEDFDLFIEAITNSRLETLYIGSFFNKTKNVKKFLEALKNNKSIKKIDLSDNHIDYEATKVLAELLLVNTTLKEIYLYGAKTGTSGTIALAKSLKVNTSLESLVLDCSDWESCAAQKMAKALSSNKGILVLHLLGIGKCINSALLLAHVLKQNKALRYVYCEDNIDGKNFTFLNEAIRSNDNVLKVSLRYNYYDSKYVSNIRENLIKNHKLLEQTFSTSLQCLALKNLAKQYVQKCHHSKRTMNDFLLFMTDIGFAELVTSCINRCDKNILDLIMQYSL